MKPSLTTTRGISTLSVLGSVDLALIIHFVHQKLTSHELEIFIIIPQLLSSESWKFTSSNIHDKDQTSREKRYPNNCISCTRRQLPISVISKTVHNETFPVIHFKTGYSCSAKNTFYERVNWHSATHQLPYLNNYI